jgi:hypothetical protein
MGEEWKGEEYFREGMEDKTITSHHNMDAAHEEIGLEYVRHFLTMCIQFEAEYSRTDMPHFSVYIHTVKDWEDSGDCSVQAREVLLGDEAWAATSSLHRLFGY